MTGDRSLLSDVQVVEDEAVVVGDGTRLSGNVSGSIPFTTQAGGKQKNGVFERVLYVPSLSYTLLSVSQISQDGHDVFIPRSGDMKIYNEDGLLLEAKASAGMYVPAFETFGAAATGGRGLNAVEHVEQWSGGACGDPRARAGGEELAMLSSETDVVRWHRRLGHLSYWTLAKLPSLVDGLEVDPSAFKAKAREDTVCGDCMSGRQERNVRPAAMHSANELLGRVSVDMCGPMHVPSLGGGRYFLIVVDQYSKYSALCITATKSAAADEMLAVFTRWERATSSTIKSVRCDRGGEFLSASVQARFQERGIAL